MPWAVHAARRGCGVPCHPAGGDWRGVRLVNADDNPDYWLVVNLPPDGVDPPHGRSIVVHTEPHDGIVRYGKWADPDPREFVQLVECVE